LPKQPEAFSRVLIDQALKDSDWDLLNPRRVRFESSGRDGRADYVLLGQRGPLAVLEAKAEDKDPYEAKEQARGYAENLRAPFVILSNGREHWFWNYARADQQDAYRIERLPSPKTSNAGKGGDASTHSARPLGEGRQHWPLPTSQEYYVGVLGSEADLCFNLRIEDNALLSKRFASAPFGLTPGRIRDEEDLTCHD